MKIRMLEWYHRQNCYEHTIKGDRMEFQNPTVEYKGKCWT